MDLNWNDIMHFYLLLSKGEKWKNLLVSYFVTGLLKIIRKLWCNQSNQHKRSAPGNPDWAWGKKNISMIKFIKRLFSMTHYSEAVWVGWGVSAQNWQNRQVTPGDFHLLDLKQKKWLLELPDASLVNNELNATRVSSSSQKTDGQVPRMSSCYRLLVTEHPRW